jgi:hypothetical protein
MPVHCFKLTLPQFAVTVIVITHTLQVVLMSTPDFINVNVTAPGAIVALGLLYLQTDDKTQVIPFSNRW